MNCRDVRSSFRPNDRSNGSKVVTTSTTSLDRDDIPQTILITTPLGRISRPLIIEIERQTRIPRLRAILDSSKKKAGKKGSTSIDLDRITQPQCRHP
jgi:hypothetical protein